ncbi:MAG: hypothetical protein E7473_06675 [Ruminococcaceae bacterium]|nr:hypothetical protein [Oscillospiraceae bacterium]
MKKVLLVALVFLLIVSIVGCSASEKDVAGRYVSSYSYGGSTYRTVISLEESGSYMKTVMKDGALHSIEEGDWELDGNEVILYDSSASTHHGMATKYEFSGDALENNGNEFVKEED